MALDPSRVLEPLIRVMDLRAAVWTRLTASRITVVLFVATLVALASPLHYRATIHTANESARIYAALAIVDHGTLDLSPVFDDYFSRWRRSGRPPNFDVATYEGEYRLDKAPGVSLLAVPVVAGLRALSLEPGYPELAWLLTLLFAAAPSAAALVFLYRWFDRELGSTAASIGGFAVLASPWLVYGGLLFSHALAASLVAVGVPLTLGPLRGSRKEPSWTFALGGLALGGAAWVEYPCMLVLALAALCLCLNRPGWRAVAGFGIAAAIPVGAILVWNAVAFSGPFDFPYAHKSNPDLVVTHTRGLYGLALPAADALYGLVLSPRRGLLFSAPWLGAAVFGLIHVVRAKACNASWRALVVGAFVLLVAMVGAVDWHGGSAIGPRYVLFLVPLFAMTVALGITGLEHAPQAHGWVLWSGAGLVLSSFVLNLLAALSYVYPDPAIVNPLFELLFPLLWQGGPARTIWDSALPVPVGAGIAVAAATLAMAALFLLPSCAARCPDRRPRHRSKQIGFAMALLGSSVLHLVVASLPSTDVSEDSVVELDRDFASRFLEGGP